jgi:hypothetical protein
MEFFLGAFEREWERRRATLLHELQSGQTPELDWDWRKRGGASALPGASLGGGWRQAGRPISRAGRGASRPMRTRFEALARGSQPAVVKLASYGGGRRVGAMISYAAREGQLAVENERGERVSGKEVLTALRGEWEHLFDNRADTRDVAVFNVTVGHTSFDGRDLDTVAREMVQAGFGDRRFVFAVEEPAGDELNVRGVVVLRDRSGERLTGDAKAAEIVQQRFEDTEFGSGIDAHFRFHGYGNGVRFATARVRDLVERFGGEVRDETGRLISTPGDAGDLVQKDWRHQMHSRKGRDVMHLIVSARAGTDLAAFQDAVRDFLGEQFAGHRYVFAVHDPSDDPKEMAEGGKRPHIHAHAIVTMRSETGERVVTSPQVFREWRELMAEKAREHGIDMELTDRREQASPPAYTRNQVRPVSYAGRTEHKGTSEAAQTRYDAKRENAETSSTAERSQSYAGEAVAAWRELAAETHERVVAEFAERQMERIQIASQSVGQNADLSLQATHYPSNMVMSQFLTQIEEAAMQQMSRPEFEAYEKRVETVLSQFEQSLKESERADFDEVAAAARDVVEIRREYLELTERGHSFRPLEAEQESRDARSDDLDDRAAGAETRFVKQTAEAANEALDTIMHSRDALARIDAGDHPELPAETYRENLDRGLLRAAELAVEYENAHVHEAAKDDRQLADRIALLEKMREERDIAYNDGFEGGPIPDIAKGDAKLLGQYERGLRALEMEIAVTDAEYGIGSAGWLSADGSWTRQDSEAAWKKFDQRSAELREFQAEQALASQGRDGAATAADLARDDRAHERRGDGNRVAEPGRNEIDGELGGSFSVPERQRAPRAMVRDVPEQSVDTPRSDPPQQHVPRLQELEREIEERHERERDDRER